MKGTAIITIVIFALTGQGCDGGEPPENDTAEDELFGDEMAGDGEDQGCSTVCEGATPHCCEGQCRQCCESAHCDDGNECTVDTCSDGTCVNEPLDDRSLCTDGICCGGQCRAGGECCTSADCVGGCVGTERTCDSFATEAECGTQTGCLWNTGGGCTGRIRCGSLGVEGCEACDCVWLSSDECRDDRPECGSSWDETRCRGCSFCTWGEAACTGTHGPCSSYPNEDLCNDQLDCYWSACVDYQCT